MAQVKESLQGPLNSAKLRKIAGIKTFSVVTGTHESGNILFQRTTPGHSLPRKIQNGDFMQKLLTLVLILLELYL